MTKTDEPHFEEYKTLQTEISQLRTKIQEVAKKKEYWFEKKESLKKEIKDLIIKIKELKTETDKRSVEVAELKANRRKHNAEVKNLIKKIKNLNEEKEKAFKEYHIKIEPSKLLEKINELEKKVEIETSFEKEKKLMEEIRKLKKAYEESASAYKLVQEAQIIDKEIKESRKKADTFHQQIRKIAQDQLYHEFLELSKRITALKKTQEEAFQIFIEHKNEYLKLNQTYKEKSDSLNKIRSFIQQDKDLRKLEQEAKRRDFMKDKAADVEEKIKKKKKLTTDDLLAFQSGNE